MSLDPLSPEFRKAVIQAANTKYRRVQNYLFKAGESTDLADLKFARSGSADARDPKLLGELITDFTMLHQVSAPLAVANLTLSWENILGTEIAEHLSILDFDEPSGRLRLSADSTAWATQIRMLVPAIMQRIATEIGAEIVRSIEVVGPQAPSWKHGRRSVPGRGPRDTYG